MKCNKPGCKANALKTDEYCYFHSQKPEIIEARDKARRKGGAGAKGYNTNVLCIETLTDIKKVLSSTIQGLQSLSGGDKIGKARAIGYLCNVMVKVIEIHELEKRITALEQGQVYRNDQ